MMLTEKGGFMMQPNSIPSKHLLYMIFVLVSHIIIAYFAGFPLYISILASVLYILIVSIVYGHRVNDLLRPIKNSFFTVRNVMGMLILISATLPLWMTIGTLPTMIHYSFLYLSTLNVPLAAFIIGMILSFMLGTYIGTLSILAPLFISLGSGLNIPLPLISGALISGAVIGDRLSPVSSNFHLICASSKSDLSITFKSLLTTNAPAIFIAALMYYYFGAPYQLTSIGQENIDNLLQLLNNNFTIHPSLLLPVLLLLLLIISKKLPTVLSFLVTFFVSIGLYFYNGLPSDNLLNLILKGYHPNNTDISLLLSGSGVFSMLAVPIIILCSSYLYDLLKYVNVVDKGLEYFTKNIHNRRSLFTKTALLSILVTLISCNQSLTAIITGQHFAPYFDKYQLNRSFLARTIADTGAIVITIIPWNLNAMVATSLTGIQTISYSKYCFYVYIPIIITFMKPLIEEKVLQKGYLHDRKAL